MKSRLESFTIAGIENSIMKQSFFFVHMKFVLEAILATKISWNRLGSIYTSTFENDDKY